MQPKKVESLKPATGGFFSRVGAAIFDRREAPAEVGSGESASSADEVARNSIERGAGRSDFGAQLDELVDELRRRT